MDSYTFIGPLKKERSNDVAANLYVEKANEGNFTINNTKYYDVCLSVCPSVRPSV